MLKAIKQVVAPWRAVAERVDATCVHVTMPKGFIEEALYDAREACQKAGFGTLIYQSWHDDRPHFGVFSQC